MNKYIYNNQKYFYMMINDIALDSPVRRELEKNNYKVRPIDLTNEDEIKRVKEIFSIGGESTNEIW